MYMTPTETRLSNGSPVTIKESSLSIPALLSSQYPRGLLSCLQRSGCDVNTQVTSATITGEAPCPGSDIHTWWHPRGFNMISTENVWKVRHINRNNTTQPFALWRPAILSLTRILFLCDVNTNQHVDTRHHPVCTRKDSTSRTTYLPPRLLKRKYLALHKIYLQRSREGVLQQKGLFHPSVWPTTRYRSFTSAPIRIIPSPIQVTKSIFPTFEISWVTLLQA